MIGVIDIAPPTSPTAKSLPARYPQGRSTGLLARAGRGFRRAAGFVFELLTNIG